jgi:hypothetical protein
VSANATNEVAGSVSHNELMTILNQREEGRNKARYGNRAVSFLHPKIEKEQGRHLYVDEYKKNTAYGYKGIKSWEERYSQEEKTAASSLLETALEDDDAIVKLAKDLHSPVLAHLDYESIAYNVLDTELYKPAVPMIKHTDMHRGDWRSLDLPALIVDDEGETNAIRMFRSTLELKPFDVSVTLYTRYADLSESMYDLLGRLKDRVAISMAYLLDLRYFSLLHNASQVTNTNQTAGGTATRPFLARLANQVERHRLPVTGLIAGTELTAAIRGWNVWEVGFDTLAEINGEGYIANIFGMNIWISNKISDQSGTSPVYAVASPKFHGFRGVRQTLMVQLSNDPRRNIVGVSAYERYAMALWNPLSSCYGTFTSTSDPSWYS